MQPLSKIQSLVLRYAMRGWHQRDIAARERLTYYTVKEACRQAKKKLGAVDKAQAVATWIDGGWYMSRFKCIAVLEISAESSPEELIEAIRGCMVFRAEHFYHSAVLEYVVAYPTLPVLSSGERAPRVRAKFVTTLEGPRRVCFINLDTGDRYMEPSETAGQEPAPPPAAL